MDNETIKNLITAYFSDVEVTISGDGHHFEGVIISPEFEGKNRVKRHQLVYASLGDSISSGRLHAFSFKTLTPEEAQRRDV